MNKAPVLIGNVLQSFKNVIRRSTNEYLDGHRDGEIEVILTTSSTFTREQTDFMFVCFHPSYVELCYRNSKERGSLGTKICTFMTDENSAETIAHVTAVIINNHYKY